ncbi:MAG: hypothetical protein U9N58_05155 [Thermodesulfobacteriota bacterium]|nr:hypothetical protein [Thermodesulfobacteriota bacterium]
MIEEYMMEEYIKVAAIENGIEAQLLGFILTERNIPHRMRSYYDTAYDGLFQVQKGWGFVYAPESFKDEIREIISDLRKYQASIEDAPESA